MELALWQERALAIQRSQQETFAGQNKLIPMLNYYNNNNNNAHMQFIRNS